MLILPVLFAALAVSATIQTGTPGVAVRHDPLGGVPPWRDAASEAVG